jgi:hypothetical protein
MSKSGTFKIWLANTALSKKFNYNCWGEGTMFAVGNELVTHFNKVCAHSNSPFTSASFSWERGFVGECDVVVYVVYSKEYGSIINKKGKLALHQSASGGTVSLSGEMISEVYLEPFDGTANFSTVMANIIFHEIMHNKIDAPDEKTPDPKDKNKDPTKRKMITDIHASGGGGLASIPVGYGSQLTADNIELMAAALGKKVRQYTAEMGSLHPGS